MRSTGSSPSTATGCVVHKHFDEDDGVVTPRPIAAFIADAGSR